MKLFVFAALVAVAAAGRLEHLERGYLPPHGSHGSFGANTDAFGAAGAGQHSHNAGGNFAGATSNQYLPPDHGPSSNGGPQIAGSLQGFGGSSSQYASPQARGSFGGPSYQQYPQQSGGQQGYPSAGASAQFAAPQDSGSLNVPAYQQYLQQSASRQYLAPKTGQEPPQQAFDELTGYHY